MATPLGRRVLRRLKRFAGSQRDSFRPIWNALLQIFGRQHVTYHYQCTNSHPENGHPGTVITWDAVYGSRNHNLCPKCVGRAGSSVRKTKANVRLQRLVRRLFHGV